jgi:hypothetical protein
VIAIKESLKRKRSNEKNDCDCRDLIKIWKANLKQQNNDIQKENDAFFLLFSMIYVYWTFCNDHLKMLRFAFNLIDKNIDFFTLRLNCIFKYRWDLRSLKLHQSHWFERD